MFHSIGVSVGMILSANKYLIFQKAENVYNGIIFIMDHRKSQLQFFVRQLKLAIAFFVRQIRTRSPPSGRWSWHPEARPQSGCCVVVGCLPVQKAGGAASTPTLSGMTQRGTRRVLGLSGPGAVPLHPHHHHHLRCGDGTEPRGRTMYSLNLPNPPCTTTTNTIVVIVVLC